MSKSKERIEAIKMRRLGKSIIDISKVLSVSKGSVSIWCRDIRLTNAQREALVQNAISAGNVGRMKGAEVNRRKRLENIRTQERIARSMVGKLTKRDIFMLGIALYWGEGSKTTTSTTSITNSDPETILFARNWFEAIGVQRKMLRPYIFISEHHKKREEAILCFWSELLEIPRSQFPKTTLLRGRPKKIYENHDSYYGVLALRVRKSSSLKYKILGLIKACKEKAGVAQSVVAPHS